MTTNRRLKFVLENEVGELTFGSFLRVARRSMELTQSEMASTLGVSKSVVCDLEKGRQLVSPRLAVKIAKKAGLSEVIAVKLCLQDQLKRAKIKMIVELQAA
ncbi:MAG: transcriptional regulator [Deltaproteobacteria bacterium CG11_big_fil_rev_8_21_14_0_20_45_16]|nr:MAG: transcriptional regulator [Deltaproteobacteria bacterium CG11_big_fil_rev_8_21_14_0_20_45_16]